MDRATYNSAQRAVIVTAAREGWSQNKIDAAYATAEKWADDAQLDRQADGFRWDWSAWHNEAHAHFCDFVDNKDSWWMECVGFDEDKDCYLEDCE